MADFDLVAELRRPLTALLAAAVAMAFDALNRIIPFDILLTGATDEVAHLACTTLFLCALAQLWRMPRAFALGALIATVTMDLDHIPLYLSGGAFTAIPDGRPYTHTLATVLFVLLLAALIGRWRTALLGAAFGLVTHFTRDVLEGWPGVSLFWPLTPRPFVGGEHGWNILIAALTALALLGAAWRAWARGREGEPAPVPANQR